jgi:RNA:NAD 2'-phosphotransferase (TPT1/KptA family)
MKFYHGTTQEAWELIQKSGYIFSQKKDVYTSIKSNVAKSFGNIVLEINIDDDIVKNKIINGEIERRKGYNDYIFYEKIPIELVKIY